MLRSPPTLKPLEDGAGVEIRTSRRFLLISILFMTLFVVVGVAVSWVLREDLRLSIGLTTLLVVGWLLAFGIVFIVIGTRTFIRASTRGLAVSEGLRTSKLDWGAIASVDNHPLEGALRVTSTEGSETAFHVRHLLSADPSAAAALLQACGTYVRRFQTGG
jgi:hypothetical protein